MTDNYSHLKETDDPAGSMSLGNAPGSSSGQPSYGGFDQASNEKHSADGGEGYGLPSYQPQPTASPEQLKLVNDVLSSEIGIATLLNRLKSSIASTKEFALFLKKRSTLEEDHAQGMRKLSRMTQESMRRPDHRQGTFGHAYDEMMNTNERMSENGVQFALSLHQMHDELIELAAGSERSRKSWKANGLAAEQKVADMEQAMRKSKAKYDTLSEDYDKARMGDSRQTGKKFGLKGHKSAAQVEEDLLKKVQAADQTYQGHVQSLQSEKALLESTTRPEAIKALQDLIRDIDSAVSLQMQKFAAFNEKLLLSNGLTVSPIQGPGGEGSPMSRSLRQAVAAVNNDKDLNDYVAAQQRNVPPNRGDIRYERNPALGPVPGQQAPPMAPVATPTAAQPQNPPSFGPGSRASTMGLPQSPIGGAEPPQNFAPPPHTRTFSQSTMTPTTSAGGQTSGVTGAPQGQLPMGHQYGNSGSISAAGPPQLGALPFQPSQSTSPPPGAPFVPPHQRQGSGVNLGQGPPRTQSPFTPQTGPPPKPVFGMPLGRLYERDGLAVPMVVYQCIQAVDLYGLGVEGIYRQSGSMAHIQKLKNMFDTDAQSPHLDFRNPENFYHDVNSVTGLLKLFCRDLPDPLLTMEHHDSFIAAAKHDDDAVRRDSLHAIINSLPDPNYATLRAISLHLFRVTENSHSNRMNSHNLAVIFGPTLMGTDPSTAIADAGWQIKVVDTILQNTYQIFDED